MSNNLKQLRIKAGYTQKEFAEMLGISPYHLNKIESTTSVNGRNLTIRTAMRAARILKVSLNEIFLDED